MKNAETEFELTVRAYSSDLYRYAYWLCRQSHHAEDLVQESLLRAWKHWHKIEDRDAVKSWLFTIVRREFLRSLSKSQRHNFESLDEDAYARIPDKNLNPEDAHGLRQLLMEIPENLSEPLVLQVLGGFTGAEIGAMLSISEGAVLTRLSRARQWLRQKFEPRSARTQAL